LSTAPPFILWWLNLEIILADFLRTIQQFGIQNALEEWKSADFLRNLQQFGIQNASEEGKSADFLRNLQLIAFSGRQDQIQQKILQTVIIPLPGMSTLKKFKYENVPLMKKPDLAILRTSYLSNEIHP
jgi:hypothetical protein